MRHLGIGVERLILRVHLIDAEMNQKLLQRDSRMRRRGIPHRHPNTAASRGQRATFHQHPGSRNEAIWVLQLNDPEDFRYSVVYQKVQSSTGSIVMAL